MPAANLYESIKMRSVTGRTIRPGGFELTERAVSLSRLPAGAKILDLGCGVGATVEYLQTEHRFDAVGLDLSDLLLKEGKKDVPGSKLVRGDIGRLPFPDGRFDGVWSECVFSLLDDPARALDECKRVLKRGGALILTDVYARNPSDEMRRPETNVRCCVTGAMGRTDMEVLVRKAGFDVLAWEDHSRALKLLAAKLVFKYGSMAAFWTSAYCRSDIRTTGDIVDETRPGYYLMVLKATGGNR